MSSNFIISDTNPNDAVMGGCVCHPTKCSTCKGPYAIFPETEMEGVGSPHVVMSLECAKQVADGWSGAPREVIVDGDLPGVPNPVLKWDEIPVTAEEDAAAAEIAARASETAEPSGILDPATGEDTGASAKDVFADLHK